MSKHKLTITVELEEQPQVNVSLDVRGQRVIRPSFLALQQ